MGRTCIAVGINGTLLHELYVMWITDFICLTDVIVETTEIS